jgi:hypothetical protein
LLRRLPDNAFVVVNQLVLRFLLTGEAVAGDPLEATVVFTHINGRDHRTQVLRAELQNIAAQHVQGQTAQHLFGQFGLAVTQPGLLFKTLRSLNLCSKVVVTL